MTEVNAPARRYHSPRRKEQAAATRDAVLAAARNLFVEEGYRSTTVAGIARQAGVAVDTVYATIGRKPDLLREVVETAISGTGQAVPAEHRDYVIRIGGTADPVEKIRIYAEALAVI